MLPGERFSSLEAILNYTTAGLNGLRQNFHQFYRQHLMPRRFAGVERPVLLNSWESMYYDVTLDKIEPFPQKRTQNRRKKLNKNTEIG